MTALEFRRDF